MYKFSCIENRNFAARSRTRQNGTTRVARLKQFRRTATLLHTLFYLETAERAACTHCARGRG